MLKNYFKIAIRNLIKNKLYSLINIFGLAVGLTAFLFILIYVQDELSYDNYHEYADQIYRVDGDGKLGDQIITTLQAGAPVGPTLKEDFPQILSWFRFRLRGTYLVKYDNKHYQENSIAFADSTLFQFFSLKMKTGDPATALTVPNTVVISEKMAEKYFGLEDPIGKSLVFDNETPYRVTGVLEKIPTNTHFNFDFFASMASLEESRRNQWGNMNFNTYIILQEGTDYKGFEEKMSAHLIKNYFAPEVEQYIGQSWSDFIAGGSYFHYRLFPLKDIHLHSDKEGELAANSDIKYVWIFALISLFILLLASINFMNLSTARSAVRAKEIGVRKVIGAQRSSIIQQFLGESLIVTFIAMILAGGAVLLLLPYFNDLAGKELSLASLNTPVFYLAALGTLILVGLAAGSYPAFFLSKYQPVKVLKGVIRNENSAPNLRNGLVVFQFLITIFLMCGTYVVYNQLQFIQQKKLGYDKEQLLILHDTYVLDEKLQPLKEKLLAIPQVESATVSSFLPVPSSNNSSSYFKGKNSDLSQAVLLNNWTVDVDYVQTMGLKIAKGRNFSLDFPSDTMGVLINEATAAFFGEEDPIGKHFSNYDNDDNLVAYKILGVVEDFNYKSLRQTIEPLIIHLGRSSGLMTLRFQSDNIPNFIQQIEDNWKTVSTDAPFSYSFMDDRFNRMYLAEQRIGKIIATFAFLAIFIACIGLIGLATFMAQQRTKEIGIRKVLGASPIQLVNLLSKDFLKLVLIAFVIATPIAWLAMGKWLENFAYRVELEWWMFVGAGVAALGIAFLTVSWQSVRAALVNPIESLKSE